MTTVPYHQAVFFPYGKDVLPIYKSVQTFLNTEYPSAKVCMLMGNGCVIVVLDIVPDTFLTEQLEGLLGNETTALPAELLRQIKESYSSGVEIEGWRVVGPAC